MAIANQTQWERWDGANGDRWVRDRMSMDDALRPFCELLLEAAEPRRDETLLDIGCGCGSTTLAMAAHVKRAIGVDLSSRMLECARQRAAEAGLTNTEFIQADAQVADLGRERDVAISRAGVMFFDDPVAAFRNVGASLRHGGRLAFVAWRGPDVSECVALPGRVFARHLTLPPSDPMGPGPLAFADAGRVEHILAEAGWSRVTCTPVERPLRIGGSAEEAARFYLREMEGVLSNATREAAGRIQQDLVAELDRHARPSGVDVSCAAWLVTGVVTRPPIEQLSLDR